MLPPARKPIRGTGRAHLQAFGKHAIFSELSFTYPLKLISPKILGEDVPPVAIAYILSYGGGLISSDRIDISFEVGPRAILMLLTQGSTKVFRARGVDRIRASTAGSHLEPGRRDITTQAFSATIAPDACLFLLPDPVTCFSDASYSQTQTFRLSDATATLCVLDWYTSGRMSRGEEWAFHSYKSVNEVWIGGKRAARDVLLLEDSSEHPIPPLAPRRLRDRMAPYSCYATLLLFGPMLQSTIDAVRRQTDGVSQFQRSAPEDLVWSFSPLEGGGIVRVAGKETETVKLWLKKALTGVVDVVGGEAFDKTFI